MLTNEGSLELQISWLRGRGFVIFVHRDECIISLQIFFSTPWHGSDKPSVWKWWPRNGLPKFYKFHDSGSGGFFCFGVAILVIYRENVYFLKNLDCYCTKGLWCSFVLCLLICKYETFWQKMSVEFMILRWPLRPVGLFGFFLGLLNENIENITGNLP